MRVKLDAAFMKHQLVCPPGKRHIEYIDDGGIPGFYIEVREASPGHGTFYVRWKSKDGGNSHQKIGDSRVVSLTQARERAKELRARIYLGEDPKEEARARKASITLSELFEKHYLPYVLPRKRSANRDRQLYELRIKGALGDRKLNQITRQQIQEVHTALANEGLAPATCNLHLKLIRYALRLAVEWGLLGANPAARIPLFHEDNRVQNRLEPEQLTRLLEVLTTDENETICRIAMLALSTGLRQKEILSAEWRDVDTDKKVFTVRVTNSKSKKARHIPLNASAMEVVNALESKGRYEYLFVNHRTGKPFVNITKVWHRLRKKAGLPKLRFHDLRHAFAVNMVSHGRTLYEVQVLLGHSTPKVTERYAVIPQDTLREAANSASLPIGGTLKRTG